MYLYTHTHNFSFNIVINTTFHIIQPSKFISRKQIKTCLPNYYNLESFLELSIMIMEPIYRSVTLIKRSFPSVAVSPVSEEYYKMFLSFRPANFSVKGHIVNVLGFVGQVQSAVSVTYSSFKQFFKNVKKYFSLTGYPQRLQAGFSHWLYFADCCSQESIVCNK